MTTTYAGKLTIIELNSVESELLDQLTAEEIEEESWLSEESLLADYRLPNPFFLAIGG